MLRCNRLLLIPSLQRLCSVSLRACPHPRHITSIGPFDCTSSSAHITEGPKACRGMVEVHLGDKTLSLDTSEHLACEAERGDFTGGKVWNVAAGTLVRHLISICGDLQDMRVVELGSGTGIGGLAAAALGARVTVLTDQRPLQFSFGMTPEGEVEKACLGRSDTILQLLERNAERNRTVINGRVMVEELLWGVDEHISKVLEAGPFDLVLGADVVYSPEYHVQQQLLQTVSALLSQTNPKAKAIISWQERIHGLSERIQSAAVEHDLILTDIQVEQLCARGKPTHLQYLTHAHKP